MPQGLVPFWQVIGSYWPYILGIGALVYVGTSTGLFLGLIAFGASHLMSFAMGFSVRTLGIVGLAAMFLIVGVALKAIGAPPIDSYFPHFTSQVIPGT